MLSRTGLGTVVAFVAFVAFGCGSAFSAQGDGTESDPTDAAVGLETSIGMGSHDDAEVTVAHDGAGPDATASVEATIDPAIHPDATAHLDATKDQMVEASLPCAGTGGPTAVRVGSYCIDSTE